MESIIFIISWIGIGLIVFGFIINPLPQVRYMSIFCIQLGLILTVPCLMKPLHLQIWVGFVCMVPLSILTIPTYNMCVEENTKAKNSRKIEKLFLDGNPRTAKEVRDSILPKMEVAEVKELLEDLRKKNYIIRSKSRYVKKT